MHDALTALADKELDEALRALPSDQMQRFLVFVEAVRALDYWPTFERIELRQQTIPFHGVDIIQWGWNRALEHLFTALHTPGAFPVMESTPDAQRFALALLHTFGRSALLKRTADMVRHNLASATQTGNRIVVRSSEAVRAQFADMLEQDRLDDIERELDGSEHTRHGWGIVDPDAIPALMTKPGAFLGVEANRPLLDYEVDNVNELMAPLVHPWDSGHGMMMGYGARPEVDYHFLARATRSVLKWRLEAGLHPDSLVGSVSGGDLTAVVAFLTSLHMKHSRFALVAKAVPSISIHQSLTIWGPCNDLIETIADFSGLPAETVRAAIECIALTEADLIHLRGVSTPFLPLLFDIGNGLVLRPISSLLRNPFLSILTLQQWRSPKSTHRVAAPREDWMRAELYALFQGSRYRRVSGNVKLRHHGRLLTDIDGAIWDTVGGELALFQLKWQDFFTSDVRQQRSKASNLGEEGQRWTRALQTWVQGTKIETLAKALRLSLPKDLPKDRIRLFVISRHVARTSGFGVDHIDEGAAIGTWSQFVRLRYQVGPVGSVFSELFAALRAEAGEVVATKPLPVEVTCRTHTVLFENLWHGVDEPEVGT